MTRELIDAVAAWPQEGRFDSKYLYERADYANLLTGSAFMVVGRKGSGKSAVINYLKKYCGDTTRQLCHLEARDLNFNMLSDVAAVPAEAQGLWLTIIATVALSQLNQTILKDATLADNLPDTTALSEIVSFLRQSDVSISYNGTKLSHTKDMPWQERWFALKRFLARIGQNLSEPVTIHIAFDSLDASFRHDVAKPQRDDYLRLLEGLVGASHGVTDEPLFGGKLSLRPAVLMRTDILNQIPNPDSTKWHDRTVRLYWHPSQMMKLIAHRLSVVTGMHQDDFRANWSALIERFSNNDRINDIYDNQTPKRPFDWLDLRTHWRPRDHIVFLKTAANLAQQQNSEKIQFNQYVGAERDYSVLYFRSQTVDEGLPLLGDLRERLGQMQQMVRGSPLKRRFSHAEFAATFNTTPEETVSLLRKLYELSVVGHAALNAPSDHPNNRYRFQFKDNVFGELDVKDDVVIHPAIHRSLIP